MFQILCIYLQGWHFPSRTDLNMLHGIQKPTSASLRKNCFHLSKSCFCGMCGHSLLEGILESHISLNSHENSPCLSDTLSPKNGTWPLWAPPQWDDEKMCAYVSVASIIEVTFCASGFYIIVFHL